MGKKVAVVDSGSGNLRSVQRALEAVGAQVTLASDAQAIARADRIVVPGQGAFGNCMQSLKSRGLDQAIYEFVATDKPYFGICLGLQILFESSEETPDTKGLSLLRGQAKRFLPDVGNVPHMGWNAVSIEHPHSHLLQSIPPQSYFYFVHSFYVQPDDADVIAMQCNYGHPITAAIEKDNLFASQFHPEKSQGAGLALLKNFLNA